MIINEGGPAGLPYRRAGPASERHSRQSAICPPLPGSGGDEGERKQGVGEAHRLPALFQHQHRRLPRHPPADDPADGREGRRLRPERGAVGTALGAGAYALVPLPLAEQLALRRPGERKGQGSGEAYPHRPDPLRPALRRREGQGPGYHPCADGPVEPEEYHGKTSDLHLLCQPGLRGSPADLPPAGGGRRPLLDRPPGYPPRGLGR